MSAGDGTPPERPPAPDVRPATAPPPSPALPEELARLGEALEAAATKSLARRRARRQLFLNGAASLLLALPIALGTTSGELAPAAGPVLPSRPYVHDPAAEPPSFSFEVRHIPDEPAESIVPPVCLDANDCRVPVEPSLEPAPAGRV